MFQVITSLWPCSSRRLMWETNREQLSRCVCTASGSRLRVCPWLRSGSCTTQVFLTQSPCRRCDSVHRRRAASKAILWEPPQNRTASEWTRVRKRSEAKQQEGEEGMQDHMLFLLAEKQDDLIRSSAEFYTSETKLLLPKGGSHSTVLYLFLVPRQWTLLKSFSSCSWEIARLMLMPPTFFFLPILFHKIRQ